VNNLADIYEVVLTPLCWMISALGSVVLGVLGNVITPRVVAWFEARSQYRLHRRRSSVVRFFGEVVVLDGRENGITHGLIDGVHGIVLGTFFLLVALVLFFVAGVLGRYVSPGVQLLVNLIVGVPLVFLSVFCAREGMKTMRIVRTVQRRQRAFVEFVREKGAEATEANRQQFNLDWDMEHLGTNARDALKELEANPLLKRRRLTNRRSGQAAAVVARRLRASRSLKNPCQRCLGGLRAACRSAIDPLDGSCAVLLPRAVERFSAEVTSVCGGSWRDRTCGRRGVPSYTSHDSIPAEGARCDSALPDRGDGFCAGRLRQLRGRTSAVPLVPEPQLSAVRCGGS